MDASKVDFSSSEGSSESQSESEDTAITKPDQAPPGLDMQTKVRITEHIVALRRVYDDIKYDCPAHPV